MADPAPSGSGQILVRRRLTGSPLSRRYERDLDGAHATRPRPPIPWSRFDRSRYPLPALALAHDAMRMLALGEYSAVALFARLASAVVLHGAPFDLIAATARVPGDEARHAELAVRAAALLAGREPSEIAFELDRAEFERRFDRPFDLPTLDAQMVETSAIFETLAGALLTACRRRATDPTMRALFTHLVGDEVHHARLGWYYLLWRAPQWTRAERQHVADHAGGLVMSIERRFWRGRDAPPGSRRAARALGILDSIAQRETVRRVMEDEIVPGLDALGLGASHAWRRRLRGAG